MRVERVTLTHARVPLVEPFRISSGAVAEKDGIAVKVEGEGIAGWGESSPMAGAFYGADTPESCWRELTETLAPAVVGRDFESHAAAVEYVNGLAGSNFAKAGLETALWDWESKRRGVPVWEMLGGTRTEVESGLAVGLYGEMGGLLAAIGRYLRDGYKRVKIKIERGRDVELVKAVRGEFGDIPLFVDANGAYDLSDVEVFRRLDEFGLMMFEQPFAGGMLEETAELQRRVKTPVCLDESLESAEDVRRAVELGSMRIANIKIQRVGGYSGALAVYEACREAGIPVWVGTMPELGIGCAQGVALAALPHCQFPTDVEASLRWFRDDIVEPLIEVRDGMIEVREFAVDEGKLARYRVAQAQFE